MVVSMSGSETAVAPAVSACCPNSAVMSEYWTSRPILNCSPILPVSPNPAASSSLDNCASQFGLVVVWTHPAGEAAPTHEACSTSLLLVDSQACSCHSSEMLNPASSE